MIYFLALLTVVSTVILTLYVQFTVRCAKKAAKWDAWESLKYDFKVDWNVGCGNEDFCLRSHRFRS